MESKRSRGFTLIELMVVVTIIGILASIAIPNFLLFQGKAKQSEAKTNLKSIFTAETAYYGEHDGYSAQFPAIGFAPELGNRYNYAVGDPATAIAQDTTRFPPPVPVAPSSYSTVSDGSGGTLTTPGVSANCPNCMFLAVAYGNVDNDDAADVWTVGSDTNTTTPNACAPDATAAGGVALVLYDDVECP